MSPSDRCDPVAADASIHLVADELLAGLRTGLEPALVHVAIDGPNAQIGLKPLDGHHPSDLLVGFTAPSSWHALGIATRGHAYPIADRGAPPSAVPRRRARVEVVALLSRSGELAHRVHVQDDDDLATALGSTPDGATGEQIDLLRLALGLPTDPPPCGSDVFWTIEWLSALLGDRSRDITEWDDVTARHPAVSLLMRADDVERRGADFVDVVTAFHGVCTWPRLRSLVRDGRFTAPELIPSDADWFDDGGFARFLLSRCPPLSMLRSQVDDQLPSSLADRLTRTLDQLGVPRAPWPDTSDGQAA